MTSSTRRLVYRQDHPAELSSRGAGLYDPTNTAARKQYWANANTALFAKGVDAWWLDTDEPETEAREDNILATNKMAIGSGARYANVFSAVSHHGSFRRPAGGERQEAGVHSSRSAYAGAQRYGVTAWSGDVLSDWVTFQRQIPAGLNYAISGMPYWTTDIGGFISGGNLNDPKFRELFVRWFQFGAFSPIFRCMEPATPARTSCGVTGRMQRRSWSTTTTCGTG